MKNQKITQEYYTPIQLKLPLNFEKIIKFSNPVYSFNEVMNHIDLNKYFVDKKHKIGRPRYDREKLLKIVLFAFMENGYQSLRQIEKLCKTDIRFMWILDETNPPCFNTIKNFINDDLTESIQSIFDDINKYIFKKQKVDTNHVYMVGTKIKANAGNYTWVWKKSYIRNKVFKKVTKTIEKMNEVTAMYKRVKLDILQEYEVQYLSFILQTFYQKLTQIQIILYLEKVRERVKIKDYMKK